MENNKNKKSVKFQGDMLNFCDFTQVFVFTRNHHLKWIIHLQHFYVNKSSHVACWTQNCLCRTRGFPKALFIDLLVLVLHMVREIWRETGRIKAGKNFKVTEPKFSSVIALNGLAKFYCLLYNRFRWPHFANLCYHLHFQIRKPILYRCNTHYACNIRV